MGTPSIVMDNVSMTYSVRSVGHQPKGTLLNRLRQATGVNNIEVPALRPLSLVVNHGESVGVIGTNGSGKSTLMKILTGQINPTTGSVYATSTPIMLGVNAALVPQLSGEDNITLGCLAMGMTLAQVKEKRPEIVDVSGLQDSLHLPLKSYSSGMAARLQFAIATAVDPDILIIDEALNTGDAQFRDRTRERLDVLREQAGCVILVSHSLGTIKEMCSRVVWLEKGELVMDGDPEEVTEAYHTYAVHMGRRRERGARVWKEEKQADLVLTEIDWTDGSGRVAVQA